jgi:hypothetical protein
LFEEHSVSNLVKEKDDLGRLKELGLISPEEYKDQIREINLKIEINLISRSNHQIYSKEWFDDVRSNPVFSWLINVIDSPEYSNLISNGVTLSSSFNQLMNRTLVFSRRVVDRDHRLEFAIALFGPSKTVRRLVPKTGIRDMDMVIKRFDGSLSEINFFKQAMSWISGSSPAGWAGWPNYQQTMLMDLITKLVQEDMSKISASESQKTIESLYHTMGGQFDAAVRKNSIKNLINYFENGSCKIMFNGNQTYTQDMITVLSKPAISISHDGSGQYRFGGQITSLDNFNFLPAKDPKAGSISILQNPNQSREICFESLEVVLAKLARVGIKSAEYILIQGGGWFSADEHERAKRISNRHGIDYSYTARFS